MTTEELAQLIEMLECVLKDCQQKDIVRAEVEYAANKAVRLLQKELIVRNNENQCSRCPLYDNSEQMCKWLDCNVIDCTESLPCEGRTT